MFSTVLLQETLSRPKNLDGHHNAATCSHDFQDYKHKVPLPTYVSHFGGMYKQTLCVPAAPTKIHHLGHRSAKVGKPIFLSGCSFLKDVRILDMLARRSLFRTLVFVLLSNLIVTQSFFPGRRQLMWSLS